MRAAAAAQMRSRLAATPGDSLAPLPVVRRATAQDAAEIVRLHGALQAHHAAAHPDFFKPPSASTFPVSTVRDLLAQPATVIFLAEVDGAAVGYLYADSIPAQETSMTYRLKRLWIHQIGVNPEHQRQGAGAALIDAAKAHARSLGIETVALNVWAFNHSAMRFFAGQGFEAYNHRMWLRLSE